MPQMILIWFYSLMIPIYFFSHNDLSYLMETINSDIIQLSNWFLANKLSINVKKSNFMIFKPRQNWQKIDLKIEINSYRIEQVREVVFLGVILDEHISWKPHISHIASKISKSIGIIQFRSSFYLSKRALPTLYYSLVLPCIQYCILVSGSTYSSKLNRIALLQKRIVRIINKEKFDAHTDPIFKELKILKLDDIYLFHLGKFMYLFQNNLLPRPFGNLILRTNQVHNYNTRSSNQNLFYVPFCRTNLRQFCVHYQGPSFFNTLNSDIRNASSVSQFDFFEKISSFTSLIPCVLSLLLL